MLSLSKSLAFMAFSLSVLRRSDKNSSGHQAGRSVGWGQRSRTAPNEKQPCIALGLLNMGFLPSALPPLRRTLFTRHYKCFVVRDPGRSRSQRNGFPRVADRRVDGVSWYEVSRPKCRQLVLDVVTLFEKLVEPISLNLRHIAVQINGERYMNGHDHSPRCLFDWETTEAASAFVSALYFSLWRTLPALASISAPVCLPLPV